MHNTTGRDENNTGNCDLKTKQNKNMYDVNQYFTY